jgi:hypothetical protein
LLQLFHRHLKIYHPSRTLLERLERSSHH